MGLGCVLMAPSLLRYSSDEWVLRRNGRSDKVAILLSTFNGERYLPAQLDSLLTQTHRNWIIHASDDGSRDGTWKVLKTYQQRVGPHRLILHRGPRQGFARNFMSLVRNTDIHADYFAFCDQDDVWFENKLEISLARIRVAGQSQPALFCSRTRLVDATGKAIGFSPVFDKTPGFANALVQSLAGANTMLFNRAARIFMMQVGDDLNVVSHDWLAYLLVSGCGGSVVYDPVPTLDYRQHDANLVGANSSFTDRMDRLRRMCQGTFRDWTRYNLQLIYRHLDQLTPANRAVLEQFAHARECRLPRRMYLLGKSGVYRQTMLGNLGLMLAAGLGRV